MKQFMINVFIGAMLFLCVALLSVSIVGLFHSIEHGNDVTVFIDPETGCQWLQYKDSMHPRTRFGNIQVCIPVEPLPATD